MLAFRFRQSVLRLCGGTLRDGTLRGGTLFLLFLCGGLCADLFAQMREFPTAPVRQPNTPARPEPTPTTTPPGLLSSLNNPSVPLVPGSTLPRVPNNTPAVSGGLGTYPLPGSSSPSAVPLPLLPEGFRLPNTEAATEARQTKPDSLLEEETEDQKKDRQIALLRTDAEKNPLPGNRLTALERVVALENKRKAEVARRTKEERGGKLFVTPYLQKRYLDDRWCLLFDQQTSFGWKTQSTGPYGGGRFLFADGEIQSDPYHPGLLYTAVPFGDFELQLDFCAEKGAEVLLLLKTPPSPKDLYTSCYTAILSSAKLDRPKGLLLGRHHYTHAALLEMRNRQEEETQTGGSGDVWHTVSVRCDRGDIHVWLDNQITAEYFDTKPIATGHIGLLAAKGKVRFQNVLWRSSTAAPLVNTDESTAAAWRVSPEAKLSKDRDGVWRFEGPGIAESTKMFGNFVLQLEYYSLVPSAASSVFIRALPERAKSGYEVSTQNCPTRQDRESVFGVDAGSFREIENARYIRASDREWNYLTIAAADRHFQTWVNGIPVCYFKDTRKDAPPKNAAEGPFFRPGTIQLCVPKKDVSIQYRNVNVAPTSP